MDPRTIDGEKYIRARWVRLPGSETKTLTMNDRLPGYLLSIVFQDNWRSHFENQGFLVIEETSGIYSFWQKFIPTGWS